MGPPLHFVELNIFGVYIAPMAAMMTAAAIVFMVLRRVALWTGLLRMVWHPALFQFALYLIVLSALVLMTYRLGMTVALP